MGWIRKLVTPKVLPVTMPHGPMVKPQEWTLEGTGIDNLAGGQKGPERRMNHEGEHSPANHGERRQAAHVVHLPILLEGAQSS